MADPTTATPAIDPKVLGQAVADALATALPAALKPLADNFTALSEQLKTQAAATPPPAAPAKKDGEAEKPLTAADVQRMLGEALSGQQKNQQTAAQRDAYIAEKLKGVPEAYRAGLGTDPAKWATEEQTIRAKLQADLKALGVEAKTVGGDNPAGTKPAQTVSIKDLNGVAAINAGLKTSKPQRTAEQDAAAETAGVVA